MARKLKKPKKPEPPKPQTSRPVGQIAGLPKELPFAAQLVLLERGRALAIAIGARLTIYALDLSDAGGSTFEPQTYELKGRASALAESSLGLLIAVEQGAESTLTLLRHDTLLPLLRFGPIVSLATAGAFAYVIYRPQGFGARLARIDLRQREVIAERPLDHANMTVAVDTVGEHIVLTDGRLRRIQSLGSDLRLLAAVAPPAPASMSGLSSQALPHDQCCCCILCKPPHGRDDQNPPRPPADGGGQDEHDPRRPNGDQRPPSAQLPSGTDRPGDVAAPADDGGTYVGGGGRVDKYPPPNSHRPPCGRAMFYAVAELRRAGAYVLVSDQGARHVSLLSSDMNVLAEWQFGRGGAVLLTAAQADYFIMHVRDAGVWTLHPIDDVVANARPDLKIFPLLPVETKTFVGQQVYPLSYGQQPRPNEVKGLLIPIIEGDQTFFGPDLAGFDRFMKRAMLPVIKNYYNENSFGVLTDVSIALFGVDPALAPGCGPVRLARHRLADYFWPAYVAAHVDLVRPAVSAGTQLVFDGRESLVLQVTPLSGGPKSQAVTIPFFAIGFERQDAHFPSSVKFLGTETLTLSVTLSDGSPKTLTLKFTAQTFNYPDENNVDLVPLTTYLNNVMRSAETAAGLAAGSVLAAPKLNRLRQIGGGFGRLLITFAAATPTGNPLRIDSTAASAPGGDPIGLFDPILGTMDVADTANLVRLLEIGTQLGQLAANVPYNDPILLAPEASLGGGLTTTFTISDRYGGPGADVHVAGSTELGTLFSLSIPMTNSATTKNNAEAVRDTAELFTDAFSGAIQALRDAGQSTDSLKQFGCIMLLPLDMAAPDPLNPAAVLPSEVWNVSPLYRPLNFRGVESMTTITDAKDSNIQLQTNWTLIFMVGSAPDNAMICHELGHALGFGDLYYQDGYRDELKYMGPWAMMDNHKYMSHHCGYHKLQQQWIPDGAAKENDYGRVYPLGLPNPDAAWTKELLLVPIELWRDSLPGSARAAFGVDAEFPVVQLGHIDFGGDGSSFGLIEARQPGAHFSQHLPHDGGILITNCIAWSLDERIVLAGRFRRSVQLLNPDDVLRNRGEVFDLAFASEYAVKGMKVEIVDKKAVEVDVQVYRVKVTRENAEFVDLYFETGEPYWKSPDVWVDWMGNNLRDALGGPAFSDDPKLHDVWGLGQPTDQGETIRVWPAGATRPDGTPKTEPHWLVGRIHNRGTVKALDVKVNFYYYKPPGGGDGRKPMNILDADRYNLIGTVVGEKILGKDDPDYAPRDLLMRWEVPPGFAGHTCLYVQIEDMTPERESDGAAKGTRDLWGMNDAAQKNADKFEALSGSPFDPIEFDFSVHNGAPTPEHAYIEPDGLPYGMTLTVSPPRQRIAAGATAVFHCMLKLDGRIIRTGCENDQRFRIHAWRQDAESSARWGGVEYEIRPRTKTATTLTGSWEQDNQIALSGKVSPGPGGGMVSLRLDFDNAQPTWVSVAATAAGTYAWAGKAPLGSRSLDVVASFEGNRKFGTSRSDTLQLTAYPVIH